MGGGDADSADGGDSFIVTIHIRHSNGSKLSVQTSLYVTIAAFKTIVAASCDVPAEQQRLIYKGRILKDEQTLESYGLEGDRTVHLVRAAAPPSRTTNPGNIANVGANNTPNGARGVGSIEDGGFGGAGLGGATIPELVLGAGGANNTPNGARGVGSNEDGDFGGAGVEGLTFHGRVDPGSGVWVRGLSGTGLPEFEQVQRQLNQNPNITRERMNMPVIQNLVNNPDQMRNLIMRNPQMREIIDRNPELAHILNDPSILRQTLETVRNPELMREMMRNTDRAMSNIESSPEGFNMLRRMYETVQEPFLNATTMVGNTGNNMGSNPFGALLGDRGTGQARDQSPNASTTGSGTNNSVPNTNPLPNPWSTNVGGVHTNSTTAMSSPPGLGVGGLGSLGSISELGIMFGGLQDSSLLNQVMQNPAVMQIMQSLLSNPQYMNQLLGFNPQVRNMLDSNSQLREMMQNPEIIRQLTSPETMQQLLSLQQSLLSQLGQRQSTQQEGQTGGGTGVPNNMGLELLMSMFGGLGSGGFSAPNTSDVPPEEVYATQLSQLQEMGFFDTQENISALSATAGNVHAAVERLLRNLSQ